MSKTVDAAIPWIICGTGPSFFIPDPAKYRIIALNRAILAIPYAEVCAISHMESLEVFAHVLDERTGKCLIGDPILYRGGPVAVHDAIKTKSLPIPQDRVIRALRCYGYPDNREDLMEMAEGRGLCHETTIANLAISWLAQAGVTRFYSCGIDGGKENHESFVESYLGIRRKMLIEYTSVMRAVRTLVGNLKMEWIRLPLEGE